ncbi:TPA: adenosylmethionine decarboxylase [Candidatus Bathyarchaeota archaeon]|nr:adenosylmethionine decarboxylase [Candidatus Bathyarchaeota archaeon]
MIHIIAEFFGVDSRKIAKAGRLKEVLDEVVAKSRLKPISSLSHQFEPFGATCLYLLKESHLCVHTWPEHSYLTVDLFSCDKEDGRALEAFKLLKEAFSPTRVSLKTLKHELYEGT